MQNLPHAEHPSSHLDDNVSGGVAIRLASRRCATLASAPNRDRSAGEFKGTATLHAQRRYFK